MAFAFEWDPEKAAANERKHGVTFDEAATAFGDPSVSWWTTRAIRRANSDRRFWLTLREAASLRSCSPSAVTASD